MTDELQGLIAAVTSPIRREILWMTWDAELSVGEIGKSFDISGPTLSSHLATLREAGLVTMRVDGNFRRYRCNQDRVRKLVPFLAANDRRWETADDIEERRLASSETGLVVRSAVDVCLPQAEAFDAFVDEARYSAWLGAPVHIRDGRFQASLEWGTEVRGTYEVVSPPDLIAMRWDFDDDAVPLPGRRALVAYLRMYPTAQGTRVEVHQLANNRQEIEFLEGAWSMVLGRFVAAHRGNAVPRRRPLRPKRRSTSRE